MRYFCELKSTFLRSMLVVASLSFVSGFAMASESASQPLADHVIERFGNPPKVPTGELNADLQRAVDTALVNSIRDKQWGRDEEIALQEIAESGDPRLAWPISDIMRFVTQRALNQALTSAANSVLNIDVEPGNSWGAITDHLIAWDIPAPPNYLAMKRQTFTAFVPGWEKIFVEGNIDWRHVSWGGVLIDDRAFDTTDDPCNCIPAADNPEVTDAAGATWLEDTDIVFGISINGEHRAYPRQIMEVREMVNDTLGGRNLGIPYCTLCGAAQAYFTDELPDGIERPVLRTSGLLIRSNKVMYDITTHSVLDTFTGEAVTGPLADKNITLKQASVVTARWADWKKAHPQTTVLKEELALGRDFDFRNGRDASGPIFPIGDVDPRLPVHEDVIGVISPSGQPIAVQRSQAYANLVKGQSMESDGVRLVLDGGGVKALDLDGNDLGSHQAFWFAWSQFYPDTQLWPAE